MHAPMASVKIPDAYASGSPTISIFKQKKCLDFTVSLFPEWFHNTFVPIIGKKLVCILLLDNCSALALALGMEK